MVHESVLKPLTQLRQKAADAGFELAIASSFRSFERQLSIWQGKVTGERPLLCAQGRELSLEQLTSEQLLWSILRWSALPGTSRHHWGTDFDVYDASAVAASYQLQLTTDEYQQGGPFAAFSQWLNDIMAAKDSCGFFRPYSVDLGGVAPEPWHISYRPVAQQYSRALDYETFCRLMDSGCWPLEAEIRRNSKQIFEQFIESVQSL